MELNKINNESENTGIIDERPNMGRNTECRTNTLDNESTKLKRHIPQLCNLDQIDENQGLNVKEDNESANEQNNKEIVVLNKVDREDNKHGLENKKENASQIKASRRRARDNASSDVLDNNEIEINIDDNENNHEQQS